MDEDVQECEGVGGVRRLGYLAMRWLEAGGGIYPYVEICRHIAISTDRWFHIHMDTFELLPMRPNH